MKGCLLIKNSFINFDGSEIYIHPELNETKSLKEYKKNPHLYLPFKRNCVDDGYLQPNQIFWQHFSIHDENASLNMNQPVRQR